MKEKIKKFYKDHEEYATAFVSHSLVAAMWFTVGVTVAGKRSEVLGLGAQWADPDTKTVVEFRVIQRNGKATYFHTPASKFNPSLPSN